MLPTSVSCITLQHVLDDSMAVEALLYQNPNIERCIPLALKESFGMPTLPNAAATLKYLQALWEPEKIDYIDAVERELLYLLPYINANPSYFDIGKAMYHAPLDNPDTMDYLINLAMNNTLVSLMPIMKSLLYRSIMYGDIVAVKYLLSRIKTYLPKDAAYIVRTALRDARDNMQSYIAPDRIENVDKAISLVANSGLD